MLELSVSLASLILLVGYEPKTTLPSVVFTYLRSIGPVIIAIVNDIGYRQPSVSTMQLNSSDPDLAICITSISQHLTSLHWTSPTPALS